VSFHSHGVRLMSTDDTVRLDWDARGVATLTLNRPKVGNAYDGALLVRIRSTLESLAVDERLRALVVRGAGKHFQCGADLNWMAKIADESIALGRRASLDSVMVFQTLHEFPRPTLALVHGGCFGGGCGLVCCVDIALATPNAIFGLGEVRAGVAPTPISRQLVQTIGMRQARRYAMTGERFSAGEALRIGLVHEVIATAAIEARLEAVLIEVLAAAPGAAMVTKHSLLRANAMLQDFNTAAELADESAQQRASSEGREGLAAFRERRRPSWQS
jgi:methylglutaconyl-CoA hydratase